MSEMTLIGTAKAKPGKAGELEREMRAFVPQTQAEPGCLHYTMHRSLEDADTFVLVERWASKEHLDTHFQTDHCRDFIARTESIMDGMPTMQMSVMLDVDGADPAKSSFWPIAPSRGGGSVPAGSVPSRHFDSPARRVGGPFDGVVAALGSMMP